MLQRQRSDALDFWVVDQFGFNSTSSIISSNKRSFGPNSQALPIHAKTGRERGPNRLLVDGPQDDEF